MTAFGVRRFVVGKSQAAIDASLRLLIDAAYRNVPLFRTRLDSATIDPRSIRTQADLYRIPMTSRDEYVLHPRSASLHLDARPDHCYKSSTSGTTGIPLDVYMSPVEATFRKLVLLRAILRNTRFSLPFRLVEVGTGEVGIEKRRRVRPFDAIPVLRIPRSLPVEQQLGVLLASQADVLTGHPSCLEAVVERLDRRPAGFSPRLVVCRGELLRDRTRRLLKEKLGCKVVDYYSCDEIGNIAWECPVHPRRLHISTDGCVVEIADATGVRLPAGRQGSILVTNLFNHTMPFVRYRLGDLGNLLETVGRCDCGHLGPSLALIAGREDDTLWLPDGRRLSPRVLDTQIAMAFIAPGESAYYARQYQCIQETADTFRVLVVPEDGAPADLGERVRQQIEGLLPGCMCRVEWVESIPSATSGKRRLVLSKVDKPPASDDVD